jgi:hypothetical protein
VQSEYHETLYRMTIVDLSLGIHNKRYLQEALERELIRARGAELTGWQTSNVCDSFTRMIRRSERALSVFLLGLGRFDDAPLAAPKLRGISPSPFRDKFRDESLNF